MTFDPYKVLGIEPDATLAQIRAAYRAKSKTAHPDAGGSQEAFEALTKAHLVLSDADRRAKFDATGEIDSSIPNKAQAAAVGGAINALLRAIQAISDGGQRVENHDVIEGAKIVISEDIKNQRASVLKCLENAAVIDRALAKMVRKRNKADGDMLMLALRAQATNLRSNVQKIESQIKMMETSDKLLSDYDYAVDLMIQQYGTGSFFTVRLG